MQHIDTKGFFDEWRKHKLGKLTQKRVQAIDTLIDCINADPFDFTLHQMSYVLATIYHETGVTMAPVKEILQISTNTSRRKAMKKRQARYLPYYGRGYVQITWEANYQKMGKRLVKSHWEYDDVGGVDFLVTEPDMALQPDIAWDIISVGMREGLFTGKKLEDYIKNQPCFSVGKEFKEISGRCDYKGARRIVNGTDKAAKIAGYARKFEDILNSCYTTQEQINESAESQNNDNDKVSTVLPDNNEHILNELLEPKLVENKTRLDKDIREVYVLLSDKIDKIDIEYVKNTINLHERIKLLEDKLKKSAVDEYNNWKVL